MRWGWGQKCQIGWRCGPSVGVEDGDKKLSPCRCLVYTKDILLGTEMYQITVDSVMITQSFSVSHTFRYLPHVCHYCGCCVK